MRNRVKKALSLACACALVAGLAACGGSSGSGDKGTAASTTAPKQLKGTVTVWDIVYKAFPKSTQAADQLDREFEAQYPGVTVKHVAEPLANYDELLRAAFTARKGPDVLMLNGGAQGVLQWTKGLVNLRDRVTPEMRARLSGWRDVTPGYNPSGDPYGVPVGVQGDVFYYNKKLFAKAGLPTDFQPKSWDEVKAAGEKLKAAGIQPFTGGNKEGYENRWWYSIGWESQNTPEQSVSLADGSTPLTDQTVARAFAPEQTMQNAGLFQADRFSTPLFTEGAPRFGDGKGAMFLGLWDIAAYYGDYVPKLGDKNVGVFFPPGVRTLAASPNWGWTIPSFSPNKDAAWAYIQFVTSTKSMNTLYKVAGTLPNDKNVAISAAAPAAERQILSELRSKPTSPLAETMLPSPVLTTMDTELNQVMQGRESLATAQKTLQSAAEKTP